jgi:hypothetical protein
LDAGISEGSLAAWISLNSSPNRIASTIAASPYSHSYAFLKLPQTVITPLGPGIFSWL